MEPIGIIVRVAGIAVLGLLVFVLRRRWGNIPPRRTGGLSAPARVRLERDHEEAVRRLLMQGQNIQAIKRVRKVTGMGLKEAKEDVESL